MGTQPARPSICHGCQQCLQLPRMLPHDGRQCRCDELLIGVPPTTREEVVYHRQGIAAGHLAPRTLARRPHRHWNTPQALFRARHLPRPLPHTQRTPLASHIFTHRWRPTQCSSNRPHTGLVTGQHAQQSCQLLGRLVPHLAEHTRHEHAHDGRRGQARGAIRWAALPRQGRPPEATKLPLAIFEVNRRALGQLAQAGTHCFVHCRKFASSLHHRERPGTPSLSTTDTSDDGRKFMDQVSSIVQCKNDTLRRPMFGVLAHGPPHATPQHSPYNVRRHRRPGLEVLQQAQEHVIVAVFGSKVQATR